MIKIITYITLALFHVLLTIPAKVNAQKKPSNKIVISGISDSAIAVEIWVHDKFYVAENTLAFKKRVDLKNKTFSCDFIPVAGAVYISIFFVYPRPGGAAIENYVLQRGDSLLVHEQGRKFSFWGKDSSKFECQYEIAKVRRDPAAMNYATGLKEISYYEYANRFRVLNDSANAEKLKILVANKSLFNNTCFRMLQADCIYDNNWFYDNLESQLNDIKKDTTKQKYFFQFYRNFYINSKTAQFININFIRSKNYIKFLWTKIKSDNLMAEINYAFYTKVPSVTPLVWRDIDRYFTGIQREIVLTSYFKRLYKIDDSTSICLNKAVKRVQDLFLKNILTQVARKTTGLIAYNFMLKDSSGIIHHLNDFKGKAVVVDFWYTGCEWCTYMAKQLRTLAAEKDSSVTYITISIDKYKEQWKSSLKSELYSSPDELNLFTNGLGDSHPLIQYYQIHSFPTLILVDKAGKISSVDPVIANTKPGVNPNLRKAIQAALAN